MAMTTRFFWTKTIKEVNKKLAPTSFAVFPTCNGVMCLVKAGDENLNCPEIWNRFNCSQLASVSTIVMLAKLAM